MGTTVVVGKTKANRHELELAQRANMAAIGSEGSQDDNDRVNTTVSTAAVALF